jgi:hypothetical protein
MTDELDRDWIMSAEFDEACDQVISRMRNGPPLNLAEAAEMLDLPLPLVIECFADFSRYMATMARKTMH